MAKKTADGENTFLFLRIPEDLRSRMHQQCTRFGCPEAILIRMAVTKWLEEEEAKQSEMKKVKLIPKTGN